jgi:hypothetical protein
LAIKIFSPNFKDVKFNGYYVLNFPAAYGEGTLKKEFEFKVEQLM